MRDRRHTVMVQLVHKGGRCVDTLYTFKLSQAENAPAVVRAHLDKNRPILATEHERIEVEVRSWNMRHLYTGKASM